MPDETAPPPRQRRPSREDTRRRVLAAAGQVFAQRGYQAASIDEVAEAAGFSKGAVYSNFASKQELLVTLMRERIGERVEAVRAVTAVQGTPEELGRRAGSELVGLVDRQPEWHLMFVEFWAQAMRDPEARQVLIEHRAPMRSLIAELIEHQADRFGLELPVSTEQLANVVLALANGLAMEHLLDPDEVDSAAYGDVLQLLIRGIVAGPGSNGDAGQAADRQLADTGGTESTTSTW